MPSVYHDRFPREFAEGLTITRYSLDEGFYGFHYDTDERRTPLFDALEPARLATLLVYLQEPNTAGGGYTVFPLADAPSATRVGALEHAALTLDPTNSKAHYNLGVALAAHQEHGGAIEAYRAAIALEPGDAHAHFNLGSSLAALASASGGEAARKSAQSDSASAAAFRTARALDPVGMAAASRALKQRLASGRGGYVHDPEMRGVHEAMMRPFCAAAAKAAAKAAEAAEAAERSGASSGTTDGGGAWVAPRRGTALLFYSFGVNGFEDRSLHGACPGAAGKAVAQIWFAPHRARCGEDDTVRCLAEAWGSSVAADADADRRSRLVELARTLSKGGREAAAAGNVQAALAHFEHALIMAPFVPGPMYNLGLLHANAGPRQACDAFALFEKTLLLDPTHKKARAYLRDHNKHRGCPSDYCG